MCIYGRNAFDCGHQEWGPMKAQCTRYWQKCCIRTGHESFTNQLAGLCHSCQTRCPEGHDIATGDSIHLTLRLKPSMTMERAALDTAKGRPINPANLPTPDNVKSYINSCLRRYGQAHKLPEGSVMVSDAACAPASMGPRATGDLYHVHSCGLTDPNCKKVQDYQMQLMLLEHQNKRRLSVARREAQAHDAAKPPLTTPSHEEIKFQHYKLQDYQQQLMREQLQAAKERRVPSISAQGPSDAQVKSEPRDPLNEQAMKDLYLERHQRQPIVQRCGDSKDKLKSPRAATEGPPKVTTESQLPNLGMLAEQDFPAGGVSWFTPMMATGPPVWAAPSHHAIQDYEMQLMLLEQQNKKRMMMARNEQTEMAADGSPKSSEQKCEPGSIPEAQSSDSYANRHCGLQGYQFQLLELQKLEALMATKIGPQKPSGSGHPYGQESLQIMEMGSALGAQEKPHEGSGRQGPPPATSPLLVRQDANGVQWVAFEYNQDDVRMEYTIRCDIKSVNCDDLSPEFRAENCVYPGACVHVKEYKGERLLYEIECNNVGWALAHLNPCLRNKRGLIGRAVDSYRGGNAKVVHAYCEDEEKEDAAMWSTDEFDEWSNCVDDMEMETGAV